MGNHITQIIIKKAKLGSSKLQKKLAIKRLRALPYFRFRTTAINSSKVSRAFICSLHTSLS